MTILIFKRVDIYHSGQNNYKEDNMKKTFTERDREIANELSKKLERLILPSDILPLRLRAMKLRRLYEHQCNGCTREKFLFESWADYDQSRKQQIITVDKNVERITEQVKVICTQLDIPVYFQTDPRGCSLYLGTTNDSNYNTEGVAIY